MKWLLIKTSLIKLRFFVFLCLGVIACSSSIDSALPDNGEIKKNENEPEKLKVSDFINDYELIWEDDFNGSELDLSKWKYRAEGALRGHAKVSRETISLDGEGHLIISTIKDNDQYYVGQVTTDGIFEPKFGYFECRAQMQKYMGTHSAFWLQTNTMSVENNNPQENGTEIDIFEYHRKTSNQVHHNLHWNGYGSGHKQTGEIITIPFIGTGFHTFGLLWTEKEYVFFVDGEETWRSSDAISHIPEYLILSTELTGFGGNHLHDNYPDSVVFDYVRVYSLKN